MPFGNPCILIKNHSDSLSHPSETEQFNSDRVKVTRQYFQRHYVPRTLENRRTQANCLKIICPIRCIFQTFFFLFARLFFIASFSISAPVVVFSFPFCVMLRHDSASFTFSTIWFQLKPKTIFSFNEKFRFFQKFPVISNNHATGNDFK